MNEINQEDTHRTIERAAREPYGRLVAYLFRKASSALSAGFRPGSFSFSVFPTDVEMAHPARHPYRGGLAVTLRHAN